MDADDAVNYGAIGQAIAHEMTHGFDNSGRLFDEKGNLNNWWTDEDDAQFTERAKQLVKLFNEFELRGYHINGEQTLDENIADLGGLNVAWDAYQMTDEAKAGKIIDGFTPAQRFFISYTTVWRCNIRDKALELQIKEDVHSPHEAQASTSIKNIMPRKRSVPGLFSVVRRETPGGDLSLLCVGYRRNWAAVRHRNYASMVLCSQLAPTLTRWLST